MMYTFKLNLKNSKETELFKKKKNYKIKCLMKILKIFKNILKYYISPNFASKKEKVK